MKKNIYLSMICCFLAISETSFADSEQDIKFILQASNPPAGIVFEIVEGKRDDLAWAIPQTQDYIRQLKEKFPAMKFAVVSHGSEQFGLLKSESTQQAQMQTKVRSLVTDQNVPVHICGTHASWFHKTAVDFPDWVDVVPVGPAKIRDYQRSGYALIVIEQKRIKN